MEIKWCIATALAWLIKILMKLNLFGFYTKNWPWLCELSVVSQQTLPDSLLSQSEQYIHAVYQYSSQSAARSTRQCPIMDYGLVF